MKFKKIISIPTLAALAMALGLSAAWADAPNLLTYQGRILESGVLVNGTRSVTISICSTPSGAPACYDTGSQSVSVNNGLFRTTFTAPTSGTNALNGTGNRYIEVTVGGNVLTPREQLTSSPFAVVAASVAAIGIGPGMVNNGVNFSGKVGIGSSNPGGTLELAAFGSNGVHLSAVQGSAPTIGTPSACGSGPSAAVTGGSTDMAGSFTITSGSGGPTSCDTTITFRQSYGTAPKAILLTPKDTGAGGVRLNVSGTPTVSGFTVQMGGSPNVSQTYGWYYLVIE